MTDPYRPQPVATGDIYLASVRDLLTEQNAILGEIRDRLGQANDEAPPAETPGPRPVELREPEPAKAEPSEPATPGPAEESKPAPRKRATPKRGAR